ncbi:MAG: 40S ribosomal protein S19 [Nanoarchaeota archaeon]|nr:40S ribosomal protein S19 [Nanoarchaeota archaeon]
MVKDFYSKDPEKFVVNLALALKKMPEFEIPEWALYVKSGMSRERPPVNSDFWFTRAASILRQLYMKGVLGVGRMKTRYGSRKDRGGRPDKFYKAGGKIIRVILQQAEEAGLVEKVTRMQHGRRLTQSGRDLLNSIEVPLKEGFNAEGVVIRQVEIAIEENSEEKNGEVEETVEVKKSPKKNVENTQEVKEEVEEKVDGK